MTNTDRSTPNVGRKTRLSTFKPPKTDLYTKYTHIQKRSERAIAFIEGECLIPTGRNQGQPYRLYDFQKELLAKVLDDEDCVVAFVSACRGFG